MKRLLLLVLLLASSNYLRAQQLLKTITTLADFASLNGVISGDSLFFQFLGLGQSGWIHPNKPSQIVSTTLSKMVDAIVSYGDSSFYYSLDAGKNAVSISGTCANGTSYRTTRTLNLPGFYIGHYTSNQLLNVLIADGAQKTFSLTTIAGERIVSEKTFTLSFDVLKDYRGRLPILNEEIPSSHLQAGSEMKFFVSCDKITIIKDEPFQEHNPNRRRYQTVVIELNVLSGQVRSRFFPVSGQQKFRSMLFNNRLYRLTQKGGFNVEVIDLNTNKTIYSLLIPYRPKYAGSFCYYRNGRKNTVQKMDGVANLMGENFYIIPHQLAGEGHLMTLGIFYEVEAKTPITNALGFAGLLASVVMRASVNSAVTGPIDVARFYLLGKDYSNSEIPFETGLAENRIDQFESGWPKEKKILAKAYFPGKNGTFGLYKLEGQTVEVRYFSETSE
jgi:hypothetical protein